MSLPPAYSKRFLTWRNDPPALDYIVPDGKVAVVKCFSGLLHSFEVFSCSCALIGPNGETIYQAQYKATDVEAQALGLGFVWFGSAVYYEREPIGLVIPNGNADGMVSGYLLSAQ